MQRTILEGKSAWISVLLSTSDLSPFQTQRWSIIIDKNLTQGLDSHGNPVRLNTVYTGSFRVNGGSFNTAVNARLNNDHTDKEEIQVVSSRQATENVGILAFDIANNGNSEVMIDDVEVQLTTNAPALNNVITQLAIYDEQGVMLSSVNALHAQSTVQLSDLSVKINKNTTRTFFVKATMPALQSVNMGKTLNVRIEKVNFWTGALRTHTRISNAIEVRKMLYLSGIPKVTLAEKPTITVSGMDATAQFKLNVTARGANIYLLKQCGINRDHNNGFIVQPYGSYELFIECGAIDWSQERFLIYKGETAQVTVTAVLTNNSETAQNVAAGITGIQWSNTLTGGDIYSSILTGMQTESGYVSGK